MRTFIWFRCANTSEFKLLKRKKKPKQKKSTKKHVRNTRKTYHYIIIVVHRLRCSYGQRICWIFHCIFFFSFLKKQQHSGGYKICGIKINKCFTINCTLFLFFFFCYYFGLIKHPWRDSKRIYFSFTRDRHMFSSCNAMCV